MSRHLRTLTTIAIGICLAAAVSQRAAAQQSASPWVRFFLQPSVALAQLEEVQQELKLNEEQVKEVRAINDKLNEDRMSLFQDASGDRGKMREGLAKLHREATEEFNKQLDEAQRKRAAEVYVQVNGPMVLQDEAVVKELELTEEQQEKLDEARDEIRNQFFNAGLRDLSEEEREEKVKQLLEERDEKLLGVLDEKQREALEAMKGEPLEVDLSKMPVPGRG
jgi:Spy/CpxP family protein refolding chaperone